MRGAQDRLQREHQNNAWLAWHVVALGRQDKLPDVEKFVTGKAAQVKKQSPELLQAMCSALAKAWGAT